jgi:hypothetical protein
VVVTVGFAVTVVPDVAERPVEGAQVYVVAPDAVNEVLPLGQIAGAAGVTVIVGPGETFTTTWSVTTTGVEQVVLVTVAV